MLLRYVDYNRLPCKRRDIVNGDIDSPSYSYDMSIRIDYLVKGEIL